MHEEAEALREIADALERGELDGLVIGYEHGTEAASMVLGEPGRLLLGEIVVLKAALAEQVAMDSDVEQRKLAKH
ncbi:hypothetical protein [Halorhodospira sp. 9622]|uniref:hypothetical protein n=1 Tax=Halorhodospira sp. 9622 TaxID=2899136 RepID=UPI001EE874B4|nr:hypothetical protein [Halorhodospira sp. 9622]MCG5538957.1 hypothetical protein [Halorhodospira sp. 9622]